MKYLLINSLYKSLKKFTEKFTEKWENLVSHYFLNIAERQFIELNRSHLAQNKGSPKKELKILVQMPEDYSYFVFFSSIIRSLSKDFDLNIGWIGVLTELERMGSFGFLKRNRFYERKWTKLYLSNGGSKVFSNIYYQNRLDRDLVTKGNQIFRLLKSKEDLIDLKFMGIWVGDLVYDSYLRFKPAATVELKDPFLERLIISALHIVKDAKRLVSDVEYDYLFTSHISYVHHGIMVRVFQEKNIPVLAFASHVQAAYPVQSDLLDYPKIISEYRNIFKGLSEVEQKQARKESELAFSQRFAGQVDSGTSYMRESAYHSAHHSTDASEKVFLQSNNKRIVVFLHCFFDSPHIYGRMLYSDFLEWIEVTLTISLQAGYEVYVKPHPNGLSGNEEIVERLAKNFPKVHFLSKKISNRQLISEGFDLAVTVYGTLGHEFPYFKIPVLNAGVNPHQYYDFCTHPQSKAEYEKYLRNIKLVPIPSEVLRSQILEFYYMHNIYPFPGKYLNEDAQFIVSDIRGIVTKKDLQQHILKCQDEQYRSKIDQIIYDSFKEAL